MKYCSATERIITSNENYTITSAPVPRITMLSRIPAIVETIDSLASLGWQMVKRVELFIREPGPLIESH